MSNKEKILIGVWVALLVLMALIPVKEMLHMRFFYSGAEAAGYLQSLSYSDFVFYHLHGVLDLAFIGFFSWWMYLRLKSVWVLSYVMVDLLETIGTLLVLDEVVPTWAPVLGYLTLLKWMSAGILLLGLLPLRRNSACD